MLEDGKEKLINGYIIVGYDTPIVVAYPYTNRGSKFLDSGNNPGFSRTSGKSGHSSLHPLAHIDPVTTDPESLRSKVRLVHRRITS